MMLIMSYALTQSSSTSDVLGILYYNRCRDNLEQTLAFQQMQTQVWVQLILVEVKAMV